MKKILLNLLLLLCAMGYSGTVMAQLWHPKELDIVDRSRINEGRMKVMLEMGGLRMQGILENTNTPTEEELQSIIRQVMMNMGINFGDLDDSQKIIEAAQSVSGVNWWFLGEMGLRVLGHGDAIDWYKKIKSFETDGKTWEDRAKDYMFDKVKGDIDDKVEKELKGGFYKYALNNDARKIAKVEKVFARYGCYVTGTFDAIKSLKMELDRLDGELEILDRAAECAAVINVFYRLVNIRIMERLEKGQWVINFDSHNDAIGKTLFDIPIFQQSKVKVQLKRVSNSIADPEDPSDWSGIYRGKFRIELYHDSKELDRVFIQKIFFNNHLPYDDMWPDEAKKQYKLTDASKPSTLSRVIENDNFQIMVEKHQNQQYSRDDAMVFNTGEGSFKGNTEFLVGPVIEAGLIMLENMENAVSEQHVSEIGYEFNQKVQNHFEFTADVGAQRYPYLKFGDHFFDNFGDFKVTIPGQEQYKKWDNSIASPEKGPRFVIDYDIFKDLDMGRMYVKGRTHNSYLLGYYYLDHQIAKAKRK